MKRFILFIAILFFASELNHAAAQQSLSSPSDILAEADKARGNDEGVEWIVDLDALENGRKLNQTLRIKARGFSVLAEFVSPAKVKGRKILMNDRNMWFIKPGLRKPVPISPRQKLMGGASNGDIASTNYADDYEAQLEKEMDWQGEPCYVLRLKAANKKTTYDQIEYWVSKERLVGVRAFFFSASGKTLKSATFSYKNRVVLDGKPQAFISRMVITDGVMEENITTMNYREIQLKKISDAVFNLNLLVH